MRLRLLAGAYALVAAAFFAINHHAYGGFFSSDDLDNLVNTRIPGLEMFSQGFASLQYDAFNFRPVGHVTYRWITQAAGLNFPVFVGFVQLLHLVNAGLLLAWLARRQNLPLHAASAAALTFLFHPALFAAFWKPMFLFDVWSAFFTLLTLLLFEARRAWPLAILTFWCAYKSKEVAIFLPAAMLLLHGWNARLLPLFAISLNFGLQAMRVNSARDDAYTLRYSWAALATSIPFYLRASLGLPLLAGFAGQTRGAWAGTAGFALLLIPLLLLPGRMIGVYLYVPWIFASLAVAHAAARIPARWLAGLALIWCVFTYTRLRPFRGEELARAAEARRFFQAAQALYQRHPLTGPEARYREMRGGLEPWGFEAAIRLASDRLTLKMEPATPGNAHLPDLPLPPPQ